MLTKFTHQARKKLGLVKATDIINEHKYASNIFAQVMLSEDVELISLIKVLNRELNIDVNLINAIVSYINTLKLSNKGSYLIHTSKYYLLKLVDHLYGIEVSETSYSRAVNEFLASLDEDEKILCTNLSKNFYPFWRGAYRRISYTKNGYAIKVSKVKNEEFAGLWSRVDELFLTDSENELLSLYKSAMLKAGANKNEIIAREKMAKIILNELKSYDQTEEDYRKATEIIQAKFLSVNAGEYFQVVSQEFFPFWSRYQFLTV